MGSVLGDTDLNLFIVMKLNFIKLILKKGKLRFRKLNLLSQTHIIVILNF